MAGEFLRTPKGTATDKTGALTLTVSSVALARRLLVVGITYDTGQGSPTIKWGGHLMAPIETVTGNGITTRIVAYKRHREQKTRDIVATWAGSAPTAKSMWATAWQHIPETGSERLGRLDKSSSLAQAATASPNAGSSVTSIYPEEVFIGAMGSEGPGSDAAGTPSNGYLAGQRAGTAGAPPGSNITCQEIYKTVTSTESTQAALTGVTSRDWGCALTTWTDNERRDFTIVNYDWEWMEDIFDDADLDTSTAVFHRDPLRGRMELYSVDLEADATLIAHWVDDDTTDWITE